jgi:threonine/homoserine/homoserine lactone efflux protein
VIVASTMADLLPEDKIDLCQSQGVPAVWGLTTGIKVADAMRRPFGDPARLRTISSIAGSTEAGVWLAEHEAKELLAKGGVAVPRGGVATSVDEVDAVVGSLDGPLALKLSSASLQHKSDIGALELDVVGSEAARSAFTRLRTIEGHQASPVLIEQMEQPGVELLIAARRDSVVPALVVGLGGVWVETVGDAAVLPLPADAGQVEAALRGLRAASLLTGGRGRPAVDLAAVADLAVRVGKLLIDEDLMLIELNPVFARPVGTAHGAVAVALSPIPIVAVVLLLGTPRAKVNGAAFALGWIVGMALVMAIVLVLFGAGEASDATQTSVRWGTLVLGVLMVVLAIGQWRKRPRRGEDAPLPTWVTKVDGFTPAKSLAAGALLSGVNPKNLALTLAAAGAIAVDGLDNAQQFWAAAVFVAIASSSVVVLVLAALVAPKATAQPLASIRQFMADNNAVIMAVVLLLLGVKLVGDALSG